MSRSFAAFLRLGAIFLLFFASLHAASAAPTVIANTRSWQELYLASVFSEMIGYDFLSFDNLAEAQLKTKLVPPGTTILILESSRPVVKNYANYLRVNGYTDYETISYADYADLQEQILSTADVEGLVLLDPMFGVEALTATPLLFDRSLAPFFLSPETKGDLRSLPKPSVIVGHFPVRLLSDLDAPLKLTGMQEENIQALQKEVHATNTQSWGVITRADRVDLSTLKQHRPIYVYYGDMSSFSRLIGESPLSNFEVIATDTSQIAQQAEQQSGKDLKLILKYARTFTNLQGMAGKLLDIDTIPFEFPFPSLQLAGVTYLPAMDLLALTLRNDGNVPVSFSSNVEFNQLSLGDDTPHFLRPGQAITIPYLFGGPLENVNPETILNIRYGESLPFSRAITADDGSPILFRQATESAHFEQPSVELGKVSYNDVEGFFEVHVENPTSFPLQVFSEIILGESSVISSDLTTITAKSSQRLRLPTPYLRLSDVLRDSYPVLLYFGHTDTYSTQSFNVTEIDIIKPTAGLIFIDRIVEIGARGIVIPLLLLAAVILLILLRRRRRRS